MPALKKLSRRRTLWVVAGGLPALALIALAVRRIGDAPETQWRTIQTAVEQKRWDEAERGLIRWVERFPDDGNAWVKLGGLRGVRNRPDDALAALKRVKDSDPAWPQAQNLIGEIELRRDRIPEAEEAFRTAARCDPKAVGPRARLVYVLTIQERPDEARAVLWELYHLTRSPRHLVTLAGLAGVEPDADARGLEPALERFLAQSPGDVWLRRARGLMSLRQGRPAAALPDLEAVAQLEDDPVGRSALVECRIALGRTGDVDALLGPLPASPGDRGRWWLLKGQDEQARGHEDRALACLREAVAADPENRAAQYRLGQALVRRGEAESAAPHLDRVKAIEHRQSRLKALLGQFNSREVENVALLEALGELCLESGRPAEARAWYEQALRLDPSRETIQSAMFRLANVPEPPKVIPRGRAFAATVPKPVAESPSPRAGPRFEDIAGPAGLNFRYESGATDELFIVDMMGGGVGLIDYDGDGWLDIYLVNGCRLPVDTMNPTLPNALYRNRGDGTFEDVTGRAGVGGRGYGMGCAVGDYDNDGHDDLFVTGFRETVLYRNRGDGTFEDVTDRAGVRSSRWCTAAGFGDLDGDGDLDLVVVTYVDADPSQDTPCHDATGRRTHCPPGKYSPQLDHLFRNNGDGTFTDAAREAGLDVPNGPGLGLAIADLDGDGKLDVFVANDAVPNFLFRNLGGLRFEEVAVRAGLAYDGDGHATASMGVVADDLDGDGLIDVFHTNFLNEPDTLAKNLGGGQFTDITATAGLDAPSRTVTGFGTIALDADNDGRLDLFVANGHVDDQPWLDRPMAQLPHFFVSVADGRFVLADASATAPYFTRPVVGRGAAVGDLDNDGRLDIVVVHRDAPPALLRNMSRAGHYIGLRLRGSASGSTPVGARVTCRIGARTLVRWVTSGTSYLSASDPRLWFGLGSSRSVDSMEVRWPSGTVQTWSDVAGDRIIEIREGREPVETIGRPKP